MELRLGGLFVGRLGGGRMSRTGKYGGRPDSACTPTPDHNRTVQTVNAAGVAAEPGTGQIASRWPCLPLAQWKDGQQKKEAKPPPFHPIPPDEGGRFACWLDGLLLGGGPIVKNLRQHDPHGEEDCKSSDCN